MRPPMKRKSRRGFPGRLLATIVEKLALMPGMLQRDGDCRDRIDAGGSRMLAPARRSADAAR